MRDRTLGDWPAFPRPNEATEGLTMREYAAVAIAAALAGRACVHPPEPKQLAGQAIAIADELAAQLMVGHEAGRLAKTLEQEVA
jgi:hypothetical protein